MENNKYLLTIHFPFESLDDPEARKEALGIIADLGIREEEMENVKLQRLRKGSPPERVSI